MPLNLSSPISLLSMQLGGRSSGESSHQTLNSSSTRAGGDEILEEKKQSPAQSSVLVTYTARAKKWTKKKRKTIGSPIITDPQTHYEAMNRLNVQRSQATAKAIKDGQAMQKAVMEECYKNGKDPPPYCLEALIGKGSFGRVYKGKNMRSAQVVAVKIIDIDESDSVQPRQADAYSEFLKEINALALLNETKARNINHVIEALDVGKAMWLITDYCGGGSVASLMKTSPGGLDEKFIVVILREVAIGLASVHAANIVHRDIKAGNVLVTDSGEIQICDFGVAGMLESKAGKRSTIIGTPHWMAPELFEGAVAYGGEVDIWAFGAMAWELATGSPPNKTIQPKNIGTAIKERSPRLEDEQGNHSAGLCSLVAFCLQVDPKVRPSIEEVQQHHYIANTEGSYPTTNLRELVLMYKKWENDGHYRQSLYSEHGAQGPTTDSAPVPAAVGDEWVFEATDSNYIPQFNLQDMDGGFMFPQPSDDDNGQTARPQQQAPRSRRRPPPGALRPAPLERVFDPNTISNYNDNSRSRYGFAPFDTVEDSSQNSTARPTHSDLPLRDDTHQASNRETLISLDLDGGAGFSNMDTIRANPRGQEHNGDAVSALHDFSRPALSDPADINPNRRTQDWKFPSAAAPPASADPELSRFPPSSYEIPRPLVTPGSSNGRPPLISYPTEPIGAFGGGLSSAQPARKSFLIDLDEAEGESTDALFSRESRIDLDLSMPATITIPEYRRPSTANSETGSATGNPFELEKHASLLPPAVREGREPSLYIDDSALASFQQNDNGNGNGNGNGHRVFDTVADMSDFSASDVDSGYANGYVEDPNYDPYDLSRREQPNAVNGSSGRLSRAERDREEAFEVRRRQFLEQNQSRFQYPPRGSSAAFSVLPPDPRAFEGNAPNAILEDEMHRMISSLITGLGEFKTNFGAMKTTPARRPRDKDTRE